MKPVESEDNKSTYKRLFTEMIDVMDTNVPDRFRDVSVLKFLCLLIQNISQTTSGIS